jgi:hypothetical protein
MEPATYKTLLDKNVQKDYKKETMANISRINNSHKEVVRNLEVEDRVFETTGRQAFVTLKDHKNNFQNNPTCRLINPCKPEIGKISKQILQRIVTQLRSKTKLKQWRNSEEVIGWFKNLKSKNNLKFVVFDVCNFYATISPELLNESLDFAANLVPISRDERNTILQSRKCFLCTDGHSWTKKENPAFDVTMGALDGAECCELVGLFLLSQLKDLNLEAGLYRDDGLGVSNATPRQLEIIKKKICAIFKKNGLSITIEANKKCVDFLDITMDLRDGIYRPYMKPNDVPVYVNKMSNHPPAVTKNLPAGVNKRLSLISANEEVFNQAAKPYQEALSKSGYQHQLRFEPIPPEPSKKRHRRRNITWFNPPFSKDVKTNIGAKFLRLLEKCFPKGHILHPIMNRNTVKLSYRCLPNLAQAISKHNSKILKSHTNQPQAVNQRMCNCTKEACPLNGQCLTDKVIYQATVTTSQNGQNKHESYVGLTAGTFKKRWNGHKFSFNHLKAKRDTTLSHYIWDLKNEGKVEGIDYDLEWKVIARASPFSPVTGLCELCTTEKFLITFKPQLATLNHRNEMFNHCRHKQAVLLDKT